MIRRSLSAIRRCVLTAPGACARVENSPFMSTPDSKPPVTIAIVGAGSRGRTIYGRFAQDHPELARVVAVADPKPERREAMASEHGLSAEQLYEDWRQLLAAKPAAQAVVVATDDLDHHQPALGFLEAGYHLLLEKPMAPTLAECESIALAASKAKGMSAVAHVLRYTPYFRKLRQLIEEDAVGPVITVRHLEPVNYWHFAHSFVRGNWRNSTGASPFILAKCCHDFDILLYLVGRRPTAVQSFGGLSHFTPSAAPPGAADRCVACDLQDTCAYSATKFYGGMLEEEQWGWPLDVVTTQFTSEALHKVLSEGPYGRCVYQCDNNVPDHQVVNLTFESGATASLVATAFTQKPARETEVMGAFGSLRGDGATIVHQDFRTGKEKIHRIEGETSHHMGGDPAMLREFFEAVSSGDRSILSSTPEVSLLSHQMALLAERSRLHGTVETIPQA